MGVLSRILGLVLIRLVGHIIGPVEFTDLLAHFGNRLIGDSHRVCEHIGDQTPSFALELDALV